MKCRFSSVAALINFLLLSWGSSWAADYPTRRIEWVAPYPRLNGWGIATVLRTLCRELTGLFGSIAPRASITNQLPADGGLVPIQQLSYLSLIVSGFHEGVNLISFSLAEVFVFHKQLRLRCTGAHTYCFASCQSLNRSVPK